MTDIVSINAYGFELDIAPHAGGGIARLDWQGLPLLRPALSDAVAERDPLGLSCFPMTPYVSRISHGVMSWGDVTTHIKPNMAGGSHPLHGVGWRKPWAIIDQSENNIGLQLDHTADADWPWSFTTRQDFSLYTDHFEHRLSVTSQDSRSFPTSLGPHPYFHNQDATITFWADALWEISGESLPTHMTRPAVVNSLASGVVAASLNLDHCFEGWDGFAAIKWPSHAVRVQAVCAMDNIIFPCTRLQLYTPKEENFFCLEPVTARCVAFTTPDPSLHGVVDLRDQTLSITTKIFPST